MEIIVHIDYDLEQRVFCASVPGGTFVHHCPKVLRRVCADSLTHRYGVVSEVTFVELLDEEVFAP